MTKNVAKNVSIYVTLFCNDVTRVTCIAIKNAENVVLIIIERQKNLHTIKMIMLFTYHNKLFIYFILKWVIKYAYYFIFFIKNNKKKNEFYQRYIFYLNVK